jgi:hypothetical protein
VIHPDSLDSRHHGGLEAVTTKHVGTPQTSETRSGTRRVTLTRRRYQTAIQLTVRPGAAHVLSGRPVPALSGRKAEVVADDTFK